MADFFDELPKVELHCHVEGTVRPGTVVELARAAGRRLPVDDPTELYRYTSLDTFLAVFWMVQELIRTPDDWARIAYESIVDAAPHGLRYREMFFTPARHIDAGQDLGWIIEGLTRGIDVAESETGIRCALIADIDRAFGPVAAKELVQALVELRRDGRADKVIGVGLDSTELGVDLRTFAPATELARRGGFRITAHAGEAVGVGAANIALAIDVLGAERIDHGIAVIEDPALVRRFAEERIPITVCPNSNVLIANRYPRLEDHPFRAMREAGIMATINTDDPAMTDLDLGREYRTVAAALGLDREAIVACALDGIEASWLDEGDRRQLRAEFEATIATLSWPAAGA